MVRSKHKPATEAVASKYHQDAYGVSQHIREALLEGQNQHIISLKKAQVAQAAEPDQQVTEPKEEGADVPRVQEAFVTHLALKPYFEERAHDDKDVVDTYEDVPEVYKFHSLL